MRDSSDELALWAAARALPTVVEFFTVAGLVKQAQLTIHLKRAVALADKWAARGLLDRRGGNPPFLYALTPIGRSTDDPRYPNGAPTPHHRRPVERPSPVPPSSPPSS